jgi:toxin CcdB
MSQFTLYKNKNNATKERIPFLLDIQSNLLGDLETRVVVPIYLLTELKNKNITVLAPVFQYKDKEYVMMTPQLAGISKKELGVDVADFSIHRDKIIAALDFLITGV